MLPGTSSSSVLRKPDIKKKNYFKRMKHERGRDDENKLSIYLKNSYIKSYLYQNTWLDKF